MASDTQRLISVEAQRLDVAVDATAIDRLTGYFEHLARWAKRIRLTGPTDIATLIAEHLGDALVLSAALCAGRALDVGSGGGLPGLAVLCQHPSLELTLVEANRRKASFLRDAVYELGLSAEVIAMRLEQVSLQPFDAVWSRATWAPEVWLATCVDYLAPAGVAYAFVVDHAPTPPAALEPLAEQRYAIGNGSPRLLASYRRR